MAARTKLSYIIFVPLFFSTKDDDRLKKREQLLLLFKKPYPTQVYK
jgi:hypothetical protein